MTWSASIRSSAVLAFLLALLTPAILLAAESNPRQAKDHIGESATVCGKVVTPVYKPRTNGKPTFLNLDQPFPDHTFTIVVWGRHRDNFPYDLVSLDGREVCVSGKIDPHKGTPQIEAYSPDQIDRR